MVVTGAGSGIGAATATRFAAHGARVALLGRRGQRLEEVAAATGAPDRVLALATDVSDALQLADALDAVHERFGRVDLVVAGAGVLTGAPFEDSVPAEWAQMVDTNLLGMLTTAQTFSRDLLDAARQGRSDLFLVGALAGQMRFPGYAVYSAVGAAVAELARALRAEYGPRGVRVHDLAPGVTDTELGGGISDAATAHDWVALGRAVAPMGADDVARVLTFAAQMPARVNLADMVVVPTRQDHYLPGRWTP